MTPRNIHSTTKMLSLLRSIGIHRGMIYGVTALGVIGGGAIGACGYQISHIDEPEKVTVKNTMISGAILAAFCGAVGFFGAKYAIPYAANSVREGLRVFRKQ